MGIEKYFKKRPYAIKLVRFFRQTVLQYLPNNPLSFIKNYLSYIVDLIKYSRMSKERIKIIELYPCIYAKDKQAGNVASYFYQDTWLAKKMFEKKPDQHIDVGSTVLLVGILSQFTKVISVDINSIKSHLPGLTPIKGSVLKMPFKDNEIGSLSSLCVLEHIGLGRYGDKLDPSGTDKAIKEIKRVMAPNGDLYISVPIERENKVYFNAHRVFELDSFILKFEGFSLVELKFAKGDGIHDRSEYHDLYLLRDSTFGLFHFCKKA